MTKDSTTPPADPSSQFKHLATSARDVNLASDDLGKAVAKVDTALRRLNIGIPTFVAVSSDHDDETGRFEAVELGYAKVGGTWGIAIRESSGFDGIPDDFVLRLFTDAPRETRLEAIDALPALFEKLLAELERVAAKVRSRVEMANDFASEILAAASELPIAIPDPENGKTPKGAAR